MSVEKQIENMVSFIKQEAREKANEITAKANEEANIERMSLARKGQEKLATEFEKKEKQVEIKRQILGSTLESDKNLQILEKRDTCVMDCLEDARNKLASVGQPGKYNDVLRQLILQGMYTLDENIVTVRCRDVDKSDCEREMKAACAEFTSSTGRKITAKISDKALPPPPGSSTEGATCCGGVILMADAMKGGIITVQNTLDSRLELVAEQQLDEIRRKLFN